MVEEGKCGKEGEDWIVLKESVRKVERPQVVGKTTGAELELVNDPEPSSEE